MSGAYAPYSGDRLRAARRGASIGRVSAWGSTIAMLVAVHRPTNGRTGFLLRQRVGANDWFGLAAAPDGSLILDWSGQPVSSAPGQIRWDAYVAMTIVMATADSRDWTVDLYHSEQHLIRLQVELEGLKPGDWSPPFVGAADGTADGAEFNVVGIVQFHSAASAEGRREILDTFGSTEITKSVAFTHRSGMAVTNDALPTIGGPPSESGT